MLVLSFIVVIAAQASYAGDELKPETQTGFVRRYINMVIQKFNPDEVAFDESRRKFMRNTAGAAAGAGIMASGGGGAVAAILKQAHQRLPNSVLRRIARLRAGNGSIVPLDKKAMATYRKGLMKELSKTTNENIRRVIESRLRDVERAFDNKRLINSIADDRANLSKYENIFMDERQRLRVERRLERARNKLIANGKLQSLEILVLTARNLLDDVLLRKMAYQISFVDPSKNEFSEVFTEEDFKTVRRYSAMINSLEKSQLKHFSQNSFLSQWLPLLRHEANLAIEMYEVSKYGVSGNTSVKSCGALL